MAFNIHDFFKKLMGDDEEEQVNPALPQQGPVPMQRPQNMLLADPTQPSSVAPVADEPASPHSANPIRNLLLKLQPDEDKADAVAQALISGGANAMIAGGPSTTPTNTLQVLGSGLAGGLKGYQNARNDFADNNYKAAQVSAQKAKQQAALVNAAVSANVGAPGPNGFSIEQLYEIWQHQVATGDDAGARLTQEQIQQKQQTAAKNGQTFDEKGNIINAPGLVEAQTEEERGKAAGRVSGEESVKQTDDIREYNKYVDQEKAAGRVPLDFTPWKKDISASGASKTTINNGGAGNGDVFKLMTEKSEQANEAVKGNRALGQARTLLDRGVITGAGAEQLLGLRKIGAALGIVDADKIANTESFRAAVVPIVANVLHSTLGTANISDADRRFAEQFAGGNITLDESSMRRIFNIIQGANDATISDYKTRLDSVYPDDDKHTYGKERAVLGLPQEPEQAADDTPSDTLLGGRKDTPKQPVVITTREQYDRLPKGAPFIWQVPNSPNYGRTGTR